MEPATERQVIVLKRFAKNPELREIVKGKQFDELTKGEASKLIQQCIDAVNELGWQDD